MKLYAPLKLSTTPLIQEAATKLMQEQWDYRTEKLLRLPLDGVLADAVNAELRGLHLPKIAIWTVFARGTAQTQVIHCDAFNETKRIDYGIIIPVLGTKGSRMQWFDETNMTLTNVPNRDGKSTLFRMTKCLGEPRIIEELEVTESIIARISIPHRAVAALDSPRAVVSIKLCGNPQLL